MIVLFYFLFILQVASLYFFQTSEVIDVIIYLYVLFDAILLLIFFAKELKGKILLCILLSLLLRLSFFTYMQITGLKLSSDWRAFLEDAIYYTNGIRDHVSTYPKFISLFLSCTGINCNLTVMPIVFNIFSSIINIYIVFLILTYLKTDNKIKTLILCILCFLPIQMGYSVELLREAPPTFLVSVSLLFFIKWFFSNKLNFIILAFIFTFLASVFHAGCIGVTIGYAYAFAFYDPKKCTLEISLKKILFCFPIIILFAAYIALNSDIFLTKFGGVTDMDSLEDELSSWGNLRAGSIYLEWLTRASLTVQVICLPLKAFYFLFSPIIFDIRGIADLFILCTDASIFIIATGYYLKIKKEIQDNRLRVLAHILFFTLCVVACIFGLGTSCTGTAMRHRNKFIVIPLVLFGISYTYNKLYQTKLLITKRSKVLHN